MIASHSTPCGRSWLDNCLLDLGIRWSYANEFGLSSEIWAKDEEGRFHYKYVDDPPDFARMYPSLMSGQARTFIEGIEAISTHELPRNEYAGAKKLYVCRDFRDALRSAYRRGYEGRMTFVEFLNLMDSQTLLSLPEAIAAHSELWRAQEDLHVVRYEDYKKDPEATLRAVLAFLSLDFAEEAIAAALAASSFESFRATEATNSAGTNFFIGPGQASGWMSESAPDLLRGYAEVIDRAGGQLQALGYVAEIQQDLERPHPLQLLDLMGLSERYSIPRSEDNFGGTVALSAREEALLARLAALPASLANVESSSQLLYGQPHGLGLNHGSRYEALLAMERAVDAIGRLHRRAQERLIRGESGWQPVLEVPTDFRRDSAACFLDRDGTVVTVERDQPRMRSSATGTLEVLVEPAGLNLLGANTELDSEPWITDGLQCHPVETDALRFRLAPTARGSHAWLGQHISEIDSRQLTISLCAASQPGVGISMQLSTGDDWASAAFDTALRRPIRSESWGGTVILETLIQEFSGGARYAAVVDLPTGTTDVTFRVYLVDVEGAALSDIEQTIDVWLPQVESGTRPTSPIITGEDQPAGWRAPDHGTLRHRDLGNWTF